MNERIQKLIEQANTRTFINEDGSLTPELHKFAELIVKECAQVSADFVPGYGLEPFSERFNKHYGVKE
jgi:hypothetical protein